MFVHGGARVASGRVRRPRDVEFRGEAGGAGGRAGPRVASRTPCPLLADAAGGWPVTYKRAGGDGARGARAIMLHTCKRERGWFWAAKARLLLLGFWRGAVQYAVIACLQPYLQTAVASVLVSTETSHHACNSQSRALL